MRIDTEALRKRGFHVTVESPDGRTTNENVVVSIFAQTEALPTTIHKVVEAVLKSDTFRSVVLDDFCAALNDYAVIEALTVK